MKKILVALLATMLVFSLFGCTKTTSNYTDLPEAGSYPMTLIDGIGNEVVIESEPETIVSIAPSCTEILFAIGAGDMVVADSDWCNYPAEAAALEKIGSTYSLNVERIIELEPDVVFVAGSFAVDATETLNAAGIPVYSATEDAIEDIYYNIEAMGVITGHLDEAVSLTDQLKSDLAALEEMVAGAETRKVFIDLGALYTSSGMSFQGNLFALVKGENIGLNYDISAPQLSAETVIEANPDVYICMSPKEYFVMPDGFENINAFMNGEVYYVDYSDPVADIVSRPGPRFVEGMKVFAMMIHPELGIESDYITDLSVYK